MQRIITIGREFGSGGRELGKRLAEELGFAYYDKEIISAIAERSQLAEDYVNQVVEKQIRAVQAAAELTETSLHEPFMMLAFLPLPVIPYLKLTDCGLVDVRQFKIITG